MPKKEVREITDDKWLTSEEQRNNDAIQATDNLIKDLTDIVGKAKAERIRKKAEKMALNREFMDDDLIFLISFVQNVNKAKNEWFQFSKRKFKTRQEADMFASDILNWQRNLNISVRIFYNPIDKKFELRIKHPEV